jgi:hypothetical protein
MRCALRCKSGSQTVASRQARYICLGGMVALSPLSPALPLSALHLICRTRLLVVTQQIYSQA